MTSNKTKPSKIFAEAAAVAVQAYKRKYVDLLSGILGGAGLCVTSKEIMRETNKEKGMWYPAGEMAAEASLHSINVSVRYKGHDFDVSAIRAGKTVRIAPAFDTRQWRHRGHSMARTTAGVMKAMDKMIRDEI